jgi:hypothetical protein
VAFVFEAVHDLPDTVAGLSYIRQALEPDAGRACSRTGPVGRASRAAEILPIEHPFWRLHRLAA